MKNSFRVASLILLGSLAPGASANENPLKEKGADFLSTGMEACRQDIERFCENIEPGEGRLGACLHEHLKHLSKPCKRFAHHGGKGHELESLKEIDRNPVAAPAAPTSSGPKTE